MSAPETRIKLRYGLVELPKGSATQSNVNDTGDETMTKPTICRDVVYRTRTLTHDGNPSELCDRPAKVTGVHDDGTTVDLTWFGRGMQEYSSHNAEKVPFDAAGKEQGSWRWPPGSPAALESAAAAEEKK